MITNGKFLLQQNGFYITFEANIDTKMHSLFKTILAIFLVVGLVSCEEEQKPTDTDKFKNELTTFNKSMDKLDETMNVMDEMQQEIDQVDADLAKGNITEDDAARIKERINKDYTHELAKSSNKNPARKLPQWAHELGLTEPQGLKIDRNISQTTSENNPDEGYNSVLLIYQPNYDKAMEQAAIIAKTAGIPMSKDYEMTLQMEKEIGETILRGAAYMNFELGSDQLPKYTIAITVDEHGVLAISANDTYKMTQQFN